MPESSCNCSCTCNTGFVTIYKGYSTYFNGVHLMHITITGEYATAQHDYRFEIGSIKKTYENVTDGFDIDLTEKETDTLQLGPIYGSLIAIDGEGNETPMTTALPFIVENWVQGDVDIEEKQIIINVEEGTTANFQIILKSPHFSSIVHNDTTNRYANDCHPIKAITGLQSALDGKQPTISDLNTIRAGAALGATALQPSALNNTNLTGNTTAESLSVGGYVALTTNSALNGAKLSEKTVEKSSLSQTVQTSLGKADTAVQTIATGTANGTIKVDGTDVAVKGLGSAAYTDTTAYDAAGSASTAETNAKNYADSLSSNYATAAQGTKADTALQPNDNISKLTNNADYQTGTQVSSAIGTHNTSTTAHNDIRQAVSGEANTRSLADQNLQQQIDAIVSSSDVTDIVGTYAELQAYDTSSLANNSIIKVLQDESRDDETTYYRWVITNDTGSWVLIGEEGPYYTKSQADNTFVPKTTTVNNKALSGNITLNAQDVGAQAELTVGDGIDITNGTISNSGVRAVSTGSTNGTVSVNTGGTNAEVAVAGLGTAAYEAATAFDAAGSASTAEANAKNYADGLASNYATAAQGAKADSAIQGVQVNGTDLTPDANKKVNVTVPTDNSQIGNGAGYITSAAITNMQTTTNLVTSVSSQSTDTQYPSAKLFFDTCGDIETLINAL